jgi:putative DNA primase/helicase
MTTDDDSIGTSVDLEEVDRKLLAKQDQLEEPEPEPGLGEQFEAGGNGQEESETPIADEEVRQYQDQEQEQDGKKEAETDTHQQQQEEEGVSIIEEITEDILSRYRFLTIEESREILVYDKGVYAKGGEVQIEKTAESLYGYDLANRHLAEIKGHIMRMTYHKREELDADVNIINLKNGLYNIETGAFKEHTPDYLSITQKPIEYNLAAKPKLFGRYLRQVLYPTEIRTVIEVMAYTLYKDNPYEIMVKLFGYGANGKSVFTGLLTALHGAHNTSNVPLTSMLKNRFALSDLENKYINIDNELSSATIHDATILKKLTGRQPVRIERKNQRAYDTTLYAKLIFSANKIPETQDESDAFFRREMIISFPNRFEDGKGADPNLLRKMTTEEELSGIFNILAASLRRVLARGIFLGEKTIEERRLRHQLAVDPLNYFLTDAIAEDSVESDKVTKDELYEAYKRFCNMNRLAVESKISFGRIIKGKRVQEYRESSGERRTMWKGIKLTEQYRIDLGQLQLQ